MAIELLIVLLLVVANGVFAMSELAIVSARRGKLKRLADEGDRRAAAALELAEEPTRFLSTVQLGITLIGAIAAAYGGDTLADRLRVWLGENTGASSGQAHWGALAVVILGITFLQVVIGELVPKRLGLRAPEGIARIMGRPMRWLSRVLGPLVGVLAGVTDWILRLFGITPQTEPKVSDEEVVDLMQEGRDAGVFDEAEQDMVESVLSLDSLMVREIMTPRPKIVFLGRDEPSEQVWHKIVVSGHSIFPVYEGNRDNVVGIVSIKSLYANLAAGTAARVRDLMIRPLVVPETQTVRQLLEALRQTRFHVALVADEFGGITGLVTMSDVAEAVLGDIPSLDQRLQPEAKRREDGTWLIDGLYDVGDLAEKVDTLELPEEAGRDYQTVAGFVVSQLARVPTEGEIFEWKGWRFEIIDMDRHRVDKVLASPPDVVAAASAQIQPARQAA
ncbi:MAG: hemolysin family protein [Verrucomicrobiales bacterium]